MQYTNIMMELGGIRIPYSGEIWRALNLAISLKTPYF